MTDAVPEQRLSVTAGYKRVSGNEHCFRSPVIFEQTMSLSQSINFLSNFAYLHINCLKFHSDFLHITRGVRDGAVG